MVPDTPFPSEQVVPQALGQVDQERVTTLLSSARWFGRRACECAPYSTSEDSSSEELVAEETDPKKRRVAYKAVSEEVEHYAFACEIVCKEKDLKRLAKKPKTAAVWLSQKNDGEVSRGELEGAELG